MAKLLERLGIRKPNQHTNAVTRDPRTGDLRILDYAIEPVVGMYSVLSLDGAQILVQYMEKLPYTLQGAEPGQSCYGYVKPKPSPCEAQAGKSFTLFVGHAHFLAQIVRVLSVQPDYTLTLRPITLAVGSHTETVVVPIDKREAFIPPPLQCRRPAESILEDMSAVESRSIRSTQATQRYSLRDSYWDGEESERAPVRNTLNPRDSSIRVTVNPPTTVPHARQDRSQPISRPDPRPKHLAVHRPSSRASSTRTAVPSTRTPNPRAEEPSVNGRKGRPRYLDPHSHGQFAEGTPKQSLLISSLTDPEPRPQRAPSDVIRTSPAKGAHPKAKADRLYLNLNKGLPAEPTGAAKGVSVEHSFGKRETKKEITHTIRQPAPSSKLPAPVALPLHGPSGNTPETDDTDDDDDDMYLGPKQNYFEIPKPIVLESTSNKPQQVSISTQEPQPLLFIRREYREYCESIEPVPQRHTLPARDSTLSAGSAFTPQTGKTNIAPIGAGRLSVRKTAAPADNLRHSLKQQQNQANEKYPAEDFNDRPSRGGPNATRTSRPGVSGCPVGPSRPAADPHCENVKESGRGTPSVDLFRMNPFMPLSGDSKIALVPRETAEHIWNRRLGSIGPRMSGR